MNKSSNPIKALIYTTLFGFIILSCTSKVEQNPKNIEEKLEEKQEENTWTWLRIEIDNELIWISADQDTCFYRGKRDEYENSKEGYTRNKTLEKRFVLNKQQRDSVIFLGQDAIRNFVPMHRDVSCNEGQYVSIKLESYSGSISCGYSSISDWTKISATISKLAEMTFDKVEK